MITIERHNASAVGLERPISSVVIYSSKVDDKDSYSAALISYLSL